MPEGVTVRFQRDDLGRPQVMFIRDLLCGCPVCGLEHIERTYDQSSYHALTMARFRQLVADAPDRFRSSCEQCGERMGPQDVERWTVTYGFPLGPGVIQGFGTRERRGARIEYALSPYRTFDVQMQPQWVPDDDQSVSRLDHVTEADAYRELGRFLSLKAGWRRCLKSLGERGERGHVLVELAPSTYGIVAPLAVTVESELHKLIEREGGAADDCWVWTHLADDINELMECSPREWLPERWYGRLRSGEMWAVGVVDVRAVESDLRRALDSLPGTTSCRVDDTLDAAVVFPMGDEPSMEVELSLKLVALEAIVAGAAPSDWVRLWLDDTIMRIAGHV